MPFVSHVDVDFLKDAVRKGPIVVIEEHSYRGGVGSAILETLSHEALNARIALVASDQNNLSQIGDQEFLRNQNGITVENVISKFKALSAK